MGNENSGRSVWRVPVPETVWKPLANGLAAAFGITGKELLWEGRGRRFAVPRQLFWRVLREMDYSFPAIADITGHNHTTIINSLNSKALEHVFKPKTHAQRVAIKPGDTFGFLTVMRRTEKPAHRMKEKKSFYLCMCQCGELTTVGATNLSSGGTQSCGKAYHRAGRNGLKPFDPKARKAVEGRDASGLDGNYGTARVA